MKVFVSYARRDRETVELLLQDMRRAQHTVWVDEQLTGGQAWWDTILATIRGADLFVIALSPDLLKSRACHAEYEYAVACRRTVLPVMVATVSPQMAPPAIANAQILNYVERTPNATIDLVTALATAQPSQELPDPPPPPPDVPMSYMNTYRERLGEVSLTLQQQSLLLSELRVYLNDEDDRDTAIELIRQLRSRGDITESVGREIDSLLTSLPKAMERQGWGAPPAQGPDPAAGVQTAPPPEPARDPVPVSAGAEWRRDPYGRFEQRFWSGTEWTDHVSTGGKQMKDVPGDRAPSASATSQPEAPFSTGAYVGLIIATLFCGGIVGIVVGAIYLNKPARRSQAKVLLIEGIVVFVLSFLLAAASSGG
jgi:TIR domain-containing protein/uncharacterized protein DUF2510